MPLKGSRKRDTAPLSLPDPPPWFNAHTVKLFITLKLESRRDFKIFRALTKRDEFDGLLLYMDQLNEVGNLLTDKEMMPGHANSTLPPSIVLHLVMNRWVVKNDPRKGIFVHWWGHSKKGQHMPIYFMLRTWSEKELRHYKERSPHQQMQISNAALPWFIETSDMRAAGIVVLMPHVTYRHVRHFRFENSGYGDNFVILLWIDSALVFTTLTELSALQAAPLATVQFMEMQMSGGPRQTYSPRTDVHDWYFQMELTGCKQWIRKRTLDRDNCEAALLDRLHSLFWDGTTEFEAWRKIFNRLVKLG